MRFQMQMGTPVEYYQESSRMLTTELISHWISILGCGVLHIQYILLKWNLRKLWMVTNSLTRALGMQVAPGEWHESVL